MEQPQTTPQHRGKQRFKKEILPASANSFAQRRLDLFSLFSSSPARLRPDTPDVAGHCESSKQLGKGGSGVACDCDKQLARGPGPAAGEGAAHSSTSELSNAYTLPGPQSWHNEGDCILCGDPIAASTDETASDRKVHCSDCDWLVAIHIRNRKP
eukprot:3139065-Pleurochrysis_carterae.AAC.2